MKPYFLVIFIVFSCITKPSAQTCTGAPTIGCGIEKVISPAVAKPTGVMVAAATCSTLVVKWGGIPNQEYIVKAMYSNTVTNAIDTIVATAFNCDANNSCTATIPVQAGVKYTCSVEAKATIGSCPFYSYPELKVLEYPVAACSGNGVQFSGKVFLQGAYNSATGLMNNNLNAAGILQAQAASQPYNNSIFLYAGTESVGSNFYAAHPDIVDWVLLELRDANARGSIIARKAVFLKQDGTLVDVDGASTSINFLNIAAGYYTVSLRHRNHLSICTATPLDFTSGTAQYDFTTASHWSYKNQTYTSTVQIGNIWALRGGNANADNTTKYNGPGNDQNQLLNIKLEGKLSAVLTNQYAAEDLNMDGVIKVNGPGNDQNFLLNITLGGLLSTVYNEQL